MLHFYILHPKLSSTMSLIHKWWYFLTVIFQIFFERYFSNILNRYFSNIVWPLFFKYFFIVIFQIFFDRYFSNIVWPLFFKYWPLFFKNFLTVIFCFNSVQIKFETCNNVYTIIFQNTFMDPICHRIQHQPI